MGLEDELFDKYMLIRQMADAVRNKNTSKSGPLGDTTRGRGRVLSLLKQRDGISTKEMATIMGIRVSSLNEVLGKMEKDDLVERFPSPEDRRVMLVWLTDEGKAIELPDQKMPGLLFGSLDAGAQNQLCVYFEQMIASLQGELEEEAETFREAREHRARFKEESSREEASPSTEHAEQPAQRQAPESEPMPEPEPEPTAGQDPEAEPQPAEEPEAPKQQAEPAPAQTDPEPSQQERGFKQFAGSAPSASSPKGGVPIAPPSNVPSAPPSPWQ